VGRLLLAGCWGAPIDNFERGWAERFGLFLLDVTVSVAPLAISLMARSPHVMKIQNAKKRRKLILLKGLIQLVESTRESRRRFFASRIPGPY
jgi:hypothetical protein